MMIYAKYLGHRYKARMCSKNSWKTFNLLKCWILQGEFEAVSRYNIKQSQSAIFLNTYLNLFIDFVFYIHLYKLFSCFLLQCYLLVDVFTGPPSSN